MRIATDSATSVSGRGADRAVAVPWSLRAPITAGAKPTTQAPAEGRGRRRARRYFPSIRRRRSQPEIMSMA